MRVLIVKLSSLGDVVHAMPVVHDIHAAHPQAVIDWVVEPAFAPLVRRIDGIGRVVECPLRRWRKGWWRAEVREAWRAFRADLRTERYDAVIDLQGLVKSALVARAALGPRYGIANRTRDSGHEWPVRYLVDHAIRVPHESHALDRARFVAAAALGYEVEGVPRYGLSATPVVPAGATLAFVHGTSRDDKLWPEAHWIALGRRLLDAGWRIALPHAGEVERARAERIAGALGAQAEVWPAMDLAQLTDRLAGTLGVIGVDSGLSHIAVALDLPHVQIYNFPTAWRTGPQPSHGHAHQRCVEASPTPSVEAVWLAWRQVQRAHP